VNAFRDRFPKLTVPAEHDPAAVDPPAAVPTDGPGGDPSESDRPEANAE
jgi:hypothetical protein